jgi:hypothetical protein
MSVSLVTDVMPVVLDPIDALLFQSNLYAQQKIITLSLTRHDFLSFIGYHKLPSWSQFSSNSEDLIEIQLVKNYES